MQLDQAGYIVVRVLGMTDTDPPRTTERTKLSPYPFTLFTFVSFQQWVAPMYLMNRDGIYIS